MSAIGSYYVAFLYDVNCRLAHALRFSACQWQNIDDVIDAESRLKRAGKNLVFGDAVYLADNHLIEIDSEHGQISCKASLSMHTGKLRISARGIDEVEQVINRSVFDQTNQVNAQHFQKTRLS